MYIRAMFIAAAMLASCEKDETLTAYGAGDFVWQLAEVNGVPYQPTATIDFTTLGTISGQGPCNSYSASQTAPYPWFAPGPIRATRRACPDLEAETAFFGALAKMTLAEVLGPVLILSNDAGDQLVFQPAD